MPDEKAISLDNLQTFKNNCDTAYEPRKNIPTPTTANNGQVLGVENGVYAFTEGGGVGIQDVQVIDADQSGDTQAYEYSYVVNLGSVTSGSTITVDTELLTNTKCIGVYVTLSTGVQWFLPRNIISVNATSTSFSALQTTSSSIVERKIQVGPALNSASYTETTTAISSTKKYLHNIRMNLGSTNQVTCSIISEDNTPVTGSSLYGINSILGGLGATNSNNLISASGMVNNYSSSGNLYLIVLGIYYDTVYSGTKVVGQNVQNGQLSEYIIKGGTFYDIVTEL